MIKSFFQKPEKHSFEALIGKEQEKLYKVAYSYVKNEHDALDIVQEAIIKGFKSFHKLKDIEYFSTWITRIMINSALDHLKRNKDIVTLDIDFSDLRTKKEDVSIATIDIAMVFEKLKPEQKTLLLLRFYHGYSIPEIAEILKKPDGTVKSQLHRTLQQLKGKLENGGDYYGKASTKP